MGDLEYNRIALSHVRNGVNEARRLFADHQLRLDRLVAAGEDARAVQETLGLLEAYLSILDRQNEYLSQKKPPRATW
jgi:hypothetical protein